MSQKLLPLHAMGKILASAGAGRVSLSAKKALKQVLEQEAIVIAEKAIKLASHAGRRTIKDSDIKLAIKS